MYDLYETIIILHSGGVSLPSSTNIEIAPHHQVTMDVTSQNFWQTFPAVVRSLARADFVVLDLEMTGIISKEAKAAKLSVEDVYERARKAAQTHQIIQFGLTCVYYVDETDGKLMNTFSVGKCILTEIV